MIGRKFERLTVISFAGRDRYRAKRWLCQCRCGELKIIIGGNLGKTKSCGCLAKDKVRARLEKYRAKAEELYYSGKSQEIVAETMGMTRTCAGKLLRALGVKLRKTSRTHYACGSENTSWKGGRISNGHGYIQVLKPEHPRAKDGYVLEHILTMEKHLGRHLVYISMGHKNNEIVHHKNGNRSDNVLDNLEVMTHSEHMKLHGKINVRNIYKNKL